jgi:ankyrin repeat protein
MIIVWMIDRSFRYHDKNGWTALTEAACGGREEVVTLILAHGCDASAAVNTIVSSQ